MHEPNKRLWDIVFPWMYKVIYIKSYYELTRTAFPGIKLNLSTQYRQNKQTIQHEYTICSTCTACTY